MIQLQRVFQLTSLLRWAPKDPIRGTKFARSDCLEIDNLDKCLKEQCCYINTNKKCVKYFSRREKNNRKNYNIPV